MNRRRGRGIIENIGFIACVSLVLGSVAALAEDAPPTDCDTYAASDVDPQRKGAGVPLDKLDFAKAIPACLDALSHYPNSPRFQFQLGRAYKQSGDNREAVAWYRKAAEQGFALAENNLGVMYAKGLGVPRDDAQALSWFRKAAEQGFEAAEASIGISYEDGKGVAKDDVQAATWYRKAAEKGYAQAELNLGVMYLKGVGVPKDDLQAFSWIRKAAEQGHAHAQFNLGLMYESGTGAIKNDAEAFDWICKAAQHGDLAGQINLGRRYLKGIGVKENDVVAYKWLNLSAAQGEKAAAMIRDTLAHSMTSEQIAEAQRLSREWKPSNKPGCEVAADDLFTCKGTLTDQRRVGISLGDCDLNSLPSSDIKKITDVCGQPNGVDENTNRKTCYVRGVVGVKKRSSGTTVVEKILTVKAGAP
jgi:TPR repeat protein